MLSFLAKWFINIIALFVVIHTISGVTAASSNVVIVAALAIGLLNAFLRPILILLTLPFTILSLGAFTLVINAFMFYLASKFVAGFTVAGFWSAFWAALVFSVISFTLNMVFAPNMEPGVPLGRNTQAATTIRALKGRGFRPRGISLKFGAVKNGAVSRKNYGNVIDVEGTIVDEINSSTALKSDKGTPDE